MTNPTNNTPRAHLRAALLALGSVERADWLTLAGRLYDETRAADEADGLRDEIEVAAGEVTIHAVRVDLYGPRAVAHVDLSAGGVSVSVTAETYADADGTRPTAWAWRDAWSLDVEIGGPDDLRAATADAETLESVLDDLETDDDETGLLARWATAAALAYDAGVR